MPDADAPPPPPSPAEGAQPAAAAQQQQQQQGDDTLDDYLKAFEQGMVAALKLRRAMGDSDNARGIYEVLMVKGLQHVGERSMQVIAAMLGLCCVWEEERSSKRRARAPQAEACAAKLLAIAKDPPEWLLEKGGAEIRLHGCLTPAVLALEALCHGASVDHELRRYDAAEAKYQEALALAEGDGAAGDKAALRETGQFAMALSGVSQLRQSAAIAACGATPSEGIVDTDALAKAEALPDEVPPEAVALFKESVGFGLRALALIKKLEGDESVMAASAHAALGDVYLSMRNKRVAIMNYARAAQICEKMLGEAHPETLRLRSVVGVLAASEPAGKPVEASAASMPASGPVDSSAFL
jgi:tetratricopeptide (TPR) repeat protein